MWPWGHLAVGYLLYSPAVRAKTGRAPEGVAAIALALGTQFPDLFDKPLAWYLDVLPHGRSLMHSVFALVVVSLVVIRLGRRYESPAGAAFAVGHASHLAGDALRPLLAGDWANLTFLAWPLLPVPLATIEDTSLVALLTRLTLSSAAFGEILLGLSVVLLWVLDGRPGLQTIGRLVRRESQEKRRH
ncbi:metal-dependent hydrolase [Haloferax larsenii]|uniref:LexA-binding, inner membrane-associated putative hydrolase n=1 Tax=Haloferax larsenii TaxID=302484 RepID=A0A1H7PTA8_HALLR|nr:metal-dependent hydrolase [Haloferax larsenii]SEL38624.1 LexA-binding, inner membrane-associated putative hydrolase [Haloferax larsenii]